MPDALSANQQKILADRLRRAQRGESAFAWLHRLVMDAGYAPVLGERPDDKVLVTARSLAVGYGVSPRTIKTWKKEGMPIHLHAIGNSPALFDVYEVLRWHKERAVESGDPDMAVRGHRISAAKEIINREQARKIKRQNDEAEGLLIKTADIALQLRDVGNLLRRRFETLGRKFGPEVAAAIIRAVDSAQAKWEKIMAPTPAQERRRSTRKKKDGKEKIITTEARRTQRKTKTTHVKKKVKKKVVKKKAVKKRRKPGKGK